MGGILSGLFIGAGTAFAGDRIGSGICDAGQHVSMGIVQSADRLAATAENCTDIITKRVSLTVLQGVAELSGAGHQIAIDAVTLFTNRIDQISHNRIQDVNTQLRHTVHDMIQQSDEWRRQAIQQSEQWQSVFKQCSTELQNTLIRMTLLIISGGLISLTLIAILHACLTTDTATNKLYTAIHNIWSLLTDSRLLTGMVIIITLMWQCREIYDNYQCMLADRALHQIRSELRLTTVEHAVTRLDTATADLSRRIATTSDTNANGPLLSILGRTVLADGANRQPNISEYNTNWSTHILNDNDVVTRVMLSPGRWLLVIDGHAAGNEQPTKFFSFRLFAEEADLPGVNLVPAYMHNAEHDFGGCHVTTPGGSFHTVIPFQLARAANLQVLLHKRNADSPFTMLGTQFRFIPIS